MTIETVSAIILLAARHGIPVAMDFIRKLVNKMPEGDPDREDIDDLVDQVNISFEELMKGESNG